MKIIIKIRRKPCKHFRHYKSGKVTCVNPFISRRLSGRSINKFANKIKTFSREVAVSITKDFIINKLQEKQFNIKDSMSREALKNVACMTVSTQLGVPIYIIKPLVDEVLNNLRAY